LTASECIASVIAGRLSEESKPEEVTQILGIYGREVFTGGSEIFFIL
jgi:hypothetical protein